MLIASNNNIYIIKDGHGIGCGCGATTCARKSATVAKSSFNSPCFSSRSRRASCNSCSIRSIWAVLKFGGNCETDNGPGCTGGDSRVKEISGEGDDGGGGDGGSGIDGGSIYDLSVGSGEVDGHIFEGRSEIVKSVDWPSTGLCGQSCG